jgi:3',5'-cyclic AMP phosphodiesterase CpdA
MRRIVHISDLHFGNNDPSLLEPLRQAIAKLAPDVMIVSGDLVEHATVKEFEQAAAFLQALPEPRIVVPGNHDLPFYNLWDRTFVGLSRYRSSITRDTRPRFEDDEVAIFGANTSRLWPIRGGSLSSTQLERLAGEFARVAPQKVRMLVTHHPFDLPIVENRRLLVGHARRAVQRLAPTVDILLAGHIHVSSTGSTAVRYKAEGHALAFVQAGTAVSRRDKGEKNSFNFLKVRGPAEGGKTVVVETWTWKPGSQDFSIRCSNEFRLESEGWARI